MGHLHSHQQCMEVTHSSTSFLLWWFLVLAWRYVQWCLGEWTSMWERNIHRSPPVCILTRDPAYNIGICPDWGLNPQPSGVCDDTPAQQPSQSSFLYIFTNMAWSVFLILLNFSSFTDVLIVTLGCVFLMTNGVEHRFMCLFAIHVSSLWSVRSNLSLIFVLGWFLIIEFWKFSVDSGHKPSVRCIIYTYFLSVRDLVFTSWSCPREVFLFW